MVVAAVVVVALVAVALVVVALVVVALAFVLMLFVSLLISGVRRAVFEVDREAGTGGKRDVLEWFIG